MARKLYRMYNSIAKNVNVTECRSSRPPLHSGPATGNRKKKLMFEFSLEN